MRLHARPAWAALLSTCVLVGTDARVAAAEDTTPREALARIATALRQADAAALTAACTRHGRVQLDLHAWPAARGSFAPGQLQVLLARVFASSESLDFTLDDTPEPEQDVLFVRGTWRRRVRGERAEQRDRLTFALRREDGLWRIVEMRSLP